MALDARYPLRADTDVFLRVCEIRRSSGSFALLPIKQHPLIDRPEFLIQRVPIARDRIPKYEIFTNGDKWLRATALYRILLDAIRLFQPPH
jgi:hypothetical protein